MHITQGPAVECAPPCSTSGSPGNQAVSPAPPLMARSQESEDQVLRLSDHEREFLNAWFPHLESESYIIPPAHMDTVQERMAYIGEAARNTNSVKAEPLNLKEDFVDLLVIHRERGIMMAAIIPQTEDDPLAVQEELKKAAAYLKQARDVVRRSVLGDLVTQPALHQAIVLPDTTRRCLEEVLLNMSDVS
ncbi:hypothetical protein V1264_024994 [Littorina saxatilis]|uniref:Uncharacterized protein n=1 Tax=Littorina saxatilis TaxID=31220 RepID=A0AAN9AMG7_9CAEN